MLITDPAAPDFNSYASVDDLREYARTRGYACPDDDDACTTLLMQAMDYLDPLSWNGTRTDPLQPCAWPRENVVLEGTELDKDTVPRQVLMAQCRLALDAQETDLTPSFASGGEVVQESVAGAVSVSYASGSSRAAPSFPWLLNLLRGLMASPGYVELERW
ncbi:hypothetical protein V8N76_004564 [Salmonella enterica]